MNEHKEPPKADFRAEVGDIDIVMYKGDMAVTVSSRQVGAMQIDGWLLNSINDIPLLLAKVRLYTQQVTNNIETFVAGCQADGNIDTQDGAAYTASLTARSLLDAAISDLLTVCHAAYPVREGESVTLTDRIHGRHRIDPSQQSAYEAAHASGQLHPPKVYHDTETNMQHEAAWFADNGKELPSE